MKVIIGGDVASTFRGVQMFRQGMAFSEEIIKLFKDADFSIVNLESPLKGEPNTQHKCGQALDLCHEAVEYLRKCGIRAVTLANNHFRDQGDLGIINTINALTSNGIQYVGGGISYEDLTKHLLVRDTIEILNYCESEFSVEDTCGSNAIDPTKVYYDIQSAKKNGKFIIVIVHGGREKYNLPTPRMQKLYRFMIDIGANLVINHHQHCYSGYEKYNDGYIFYGLGNLFFDKGGSEKFKTYGYNEGFLLEMNVEGNKLLNFVLHPYTQGLKELIPVTLMNDQNRELFTNNIKILNSVIADQDSLAQHNEKWCKLHEREILVQFEPFSNKYLKALYRRGYIPSMLSRSKKLILLNMLRCETHNEQCITALINNLNLK